MWQDNNGNDLQWVLPYAECFHKTAVQRSQTPGRIPTTDNWSSRGLNDLQLLLWLRAELNKSLTSEQMLPYSPWTPEVQANPSKNAKPSDWKASGTESFRVKGRESPVISFTVSLLYIPLQQILLTKQRAEKSSAEQPGSQHFQSWSRRIVGSSRTPWTTKWDLI